MSSKQWARQMIPAQFYGTFRLSVLLRTSHFFTVIATTEELVSASFEDYKDATLS